VTEKMNIKKICKKIQKDTHAVSPIVATLMLVLVSVGGSASYYMWQTGWQKDVEDKASGAGEFKDSLSIGGSSTVYEFTAIAAEWFEVANPGYKVSYQSGGSGAGVASVGKGIVDIGSASRFVKDSEHAKYPDLNGDGSKDRGHNLVTHTVAWDAVVVVTANPAAPDNITRSDLFEIYNGTNMHGFGAAVDRSDASGTEEVFAELVLDLGTSTLEEAGIETGHSYPGNQELIAALIANPDWIGFTSYGMAKETSLKILDFQGTDDPEPVTPSEDTIMDGTYDGARPINYITVDEPTGDIAEYINFCLAPRNNQDIAEEAGYISIYA
jgi:phosphate transport system substrate-binding protein